MTTTDWIQAISASISAVATIVLARITYIYVRETKRMALFMKGQTEIMQSTFDQNIAPNCAFRFAIHAVGMEEGKFEYGISNQGKEIFILKKIIMKIWKEDQPENILFSKEIELNQKLSPSTGEKRGSIVVIFPQTISEILGNGKERKKVKYQGFLIIEDLLKREQQFSDTLRTLWG